MNKITYASKRSRVCPNRFKFELSVILHLLKGILNLCSQRQFFRLRFFSKINPDAFYVGKYKFNIKITSRNYFDEILEILS